MKSTRFLYWVFCFCLAVSTGQAEKFFSPEEGRSLAYPTAGQWVRRTIEITDAQRIAVEKSSGVKVRNAKLRYDEAWAEDRFLGIVIYDFVLGKHEVIDYLVAIEPSGTVQQIEILQYRESHGGEVRGAKWRSQFKGKTGKSGFKIHGDIYNITGATISCRNVTEGVKKVLAIHGEILRPLLPAAPDSPAP